MAACCTCSLHLSSLGFFAFAYEKQRFYTPYYIKDFAFFKDEEFKGNCGNLLEYYWKEYEQFGWYSEYDYISLFTNIEGDSKIIGRNR